MTSMTHKIRTAAGIPGKKKILGIIELFFQGPEKSLKKLTPGKLLKFCKQDIDGIKWVDSVFNLTELQPNCLK